MKININKNDLILADRKDALSFVNVHNLSEMDTIYINNKKYSVISNIPVISAMAVFTKSKTIFNHTILRDQVEQHFLTVPLIDSNHFSQVCKRFNISKYIPTTYNNYKYDVSLRGAFIAKELKLPEWFVIKALTTGVPEYEEFNEQLNTHILKLGFKTMESYRKSLIELHTHKINSYLNIDKGFITLAVLYLGNYVEVGESNIKIIIDSKLFKENIFELILLFLNKNGFNFVLSGNKYSENTEITVESVLLLNIIKNEFSNFNWILNLGGPLNWFLLTYLMTDNFYSLVKNKESAHFIQQFLYLNDELSEISQIDDSLYTVDFIQSSDYVVTEEEYYLPILEKTVIPNQEMFSLTVKELS